MSSYSAVEDLTAGHVVTEFDCGSDAQTTWLRRHALQSHLGGMSRVFVVRRLSDGGVVGYYALTTGSVLNADAPLRLAQGAGQYDIPVVVLTRLGVDLSEQGRGLGRALVVDAFRRVDRISEEVGVRALLIHAEDEAARSFYTGLASFEQSPLDDLQLLLLLKDPRHSTRRISWPPTIDAGYRSNPTRARTTVASGTTVGTYGQPAHPKETEVSAHIHRPPSAKEGPDPGRVYLHLLTFEQVLGALVDPCRRVRGE